MSELQSDYEIGPAESQLNRRQLLQNTAVNLTAAFVANHFQNSLATAQDPNCKKETNEAAKMAKRRLNHLNYALHPPQQESFENDEGMIIKLKLNEHYFSFTVPKNSKPEKSKLWEVVPYSKDKPLIRATPQIYLAPRSCLAGKETEKKLQAAAQAGKLPAMYPTWGDFGDTKQPLVLFLGSISMRVKESNKSDELIAFAKKHGLKPEFNDLSKFYTIKITPDNSEFSNPIAAAKAFAKLKTVEICEPDFEQRLLR